MNSGISMTFSHGYVTRETAGRNLSRLSLINACLFIIEINLHDRKSRVQSGLQYTEEFLHFYSENAFEAGQLFLHLNSWHDMYCGVNVEQHTAHT